MLTENEQAALVVDFDGLGQKALGQINDLTEQLAIRTREKEKLNHQFQTALTLLAAVYNRPLAGVSPKLEVQIHDFLNEVCDP